MKQKQRKQAAPYTIFKQQSKEILDFSMIAGRSWNKISHASLLLNTGKFISEGLNIIVDPSQLIYYVLLPILQMVKYTWLLIMPRVSPKKYT
jgi:hypothetical protein